MTILFDGATTQRIDFGDVAGGYAHKLFLVWMNRSDSNRGGLFFKGNNPYTQGWASSFENSGGIKLFFSNKFSTTQGLWRGGTNFSSGLYQIAIDYDWALTTNDPRMWVNGAAETITELSTPVGTNQEGSGNHFSIGDDFTVDANYAINGSVISMNILDVGALNNTQIDKLVSNAYESRLYFPKGAPHVFGGNLHAPAGTIKDGDTMAAGNTIRDIVSGASGVPAGSPVFKNNTVLSLGGE